MTDRHQDVRVARFEPGRWDDFLRLHADANGAGWCRCVAWWVPAWDGWGERTASENLALREQLCADGRHDGLLAYAGDEPVGWCQLGPRDRLTKLVAQLELEPDPGAWAVTCFLVAPAWRRRGVASTLLAAAVEEATSAGAARLEGYPRVSDAPLEDGEAWTGTERLFAAHGFVRSRDAAPRAVHTLRLRSAP